MTTTSVILLLGYCLGVFLFGSFLNDMLPKFTNEADLKEAHEQKILYGMATIMAAIWPITVAIIVVVGISRLLLSDGPKA